MNRLVFPESLATEFRSVMLSSELETAGFVFAEPVTFSNGARFLASRTSVAPTDAYEKRTGDHIELRPEYLAYVYKQARMAKQSLFVAHTHPWKGMVGPSKVDLAGEQISLPALFRLVPGVPHGRLILGHEDTHCAVYQGLTGAESARVWSIGSNVCEFPQNKKDDYLPRFGRQVLAFGPQGQRQVESFEVGIVGLGGTGSIVAQSLAYLGVSRFELIDPDVIDESNLNRVVGALPTDVGVSKVAVARRMISGINPKAHIRSRTESVLLNEVARSLASCDVVFCCTDSHGSRAVLTQMAYQYLVPMFDIGIRIDAKRDDVNVFGRTQMLAPGLPCLVCGGILDPELVRRDLMNDFERQQDPYISGAHVPQPAVVTFNSIVAGLATTMFLAAVTSLPFSARHQIYLGKSGTVRAVVADQNPECVVCSQQGAFGKGDAWMLPGRVSP